MEKRWWLALLASGSFVDALHASASLCARLLGTSNCFGGAIWYEIGCFICKVVEFFDITSLFFSSWDILSRKTDHFQLQMYATIKMIALHETTRVVVSNYFHSSFVADIYLSYSMVLLQLSSNCVGAELIEGNCESEKKTRLHHFDSIVNGWFLVRLCTASMEINAVCLNGWLNLDFFRTSFYYRHFILWLSSVDFELIFYPRSTIFNRKPFFWPICVIVTKKTCLVNSRSLDANEKKNWVINIGYQIKANNRFAMKMLNCTTKTIKSGVQITIIRLVLNFSC